RNKFDRIRPSRSKFFKAKERQERREHRVFLCYKKILRRALAKKARSAVRKYSFDKRKFYKFKVFLFNPLTSVFKNKFLHKIRRGSKFNSLEKLKILFCKPKCIKK